MALLSRSTRRRDVDSEIAKETASDPVSLPPVIVEEVRVVEPADEATVCCTPVCARCKAIARYT